MIEWTGALPADLWVALPRPACPACKGRRRVKSEVGSGSWPICPDCEDGTALAPVVGVAVDGAIVATATLAETLPILHGRLDHPTAYVGELPRRCVWVRPEDDYVAIDSEVASTDPDTLATIPDDRAGVWVPGNEAHRLTDVRAVTEPGGCPICDGDGVVPARTERDIWHPDHRGWSQEPLMDCPACNCEETLSAPLVPALPLPTEPGWTTWEAV